MIRKLAIPLIALLLFLSSCAKALDIVEEMDIELPHIAICALGNSYTSDAFSYVPFILKEYGITCSIHLYYRPDGSLQDLDSEWSSVYPSASYYFIDTRIDAKWHSLNRLSASDLLAKEKWDIITLQQQSTQIRDKASYSPYLENILNKIALEYNYPITIAWFMAFNRANDNNNELNLSVQKEIVEGHPLSLGLVLPVSTAIFNCQANEELAKLGDNNTGKLYYSDGIHLQEGLPCYIASLAIAEALLRKMSVSKTVLGDKIRPSDRWINSINRLSRRGNSVGVTEDNCTFAQKAAISANDHPFEIVPVK